MKILYVVTDFTSGSNIIKGLQVVETLKSKGYDCSISTSVPKGIKNHIIVFVGAMHEGHKLIPKDLIDLKRNKNKIVCDPVDYLCYIERFFNVEGHLYMECDGIIFPNKFSESKFREFIKCKTTSIPHHFDTKINHLAKHPREEFGVCYAGSPYRDPYLQNPPQWLQVNLNGNVHTSILDLLMTTPIHFSHRVHNTMDSLYKPCSKLAFAAATNSIFITSRDEAVVDVLGEDYPLYIDENIDNTTNLILSLKERFDSNNTSQYITLLTDVKDKLDINLIYIDYINFFKSL